MPFCFLYMENIQISSMLQFFMVNEGAMEQVSPVRVSSLPQPNSTDDTITKHEITISIV